MVTTCKQCGEEVEDRELREPCPKCGSTLRDIRIDIEPGRLVLTGHPAQLVVARQWTILLETAERLFDAGEHGVAVIVATTACEVVAERAVTKAFTTKKVPELEGPVTEFLASYSLKNDKTRDLYNVLTGDDMGKTMKFWEGYTKLVKQRNEVAHEGKRVDKADARRDIDSAKLFVEHVVKHNGLE